MKPALRETLFEMMIGLLLAAVVVVVLVFVAGCNGKSAADFHANTRVTFAADGSEIIEHGNFTHSESVPPPNSKEPSTSQADSGGATSSTSGSWQATAVDYAKKYAGIIYPIAAVLMVVLGVLAIWKTQFTLGILLFVAGGAFMAAQYLSIVFAWIAGICVVVGIVWWGAQYVRTRMMVAKALPGIAKLHNEGETDQAMAALRAVSPVVDKAFKAEAGTA